MKRNMEAVIFDLDGVLCFTDQYHYQAWKTLADELGIYFDEKINDRLRGISRMASLEIILERADKQYTQEEKDRFAEKKNAVYRTLLGHMCPEDVSGEVRRTLTELKNRGYRLAVGSSSKNTQLILERTALGQYFDAVADGNDIVNSKPDPEVFLKAAGKLGLAAEVCAVVEDAAAGIQAAKAAGMMAFALGGDAKDSKEADVCLSSFSDLLRYCEGSEEIQAAPEGR